MIKAIKGMLPLPVKKALTLVKIRTYDHWQRKLLSKKMAVKHEKLLTAIKDKKKIKVVFLVIHGSVWKVDSVFKKMLADPLFEPLILICPYTTYGEERMWQDMNDSYSYFKSKGYPTKLSYDKENNSFITLKEIKTDIVFFTNPYGLTREEYYLDAFFNYLSLYVPYYYMATKHAGDEFSQFNNKFFLSAWKIYWPHDYSYGASKKFSANKGVNGLVVGYPASENIYINNLAVQENSIWKKTSSHAKKIIYAPHHSIEDNSKSLSTFLSLGPLMKEVAEKYSDNAQWAFKPHPILKSKLYLHPDWGKEKTDTYYEFWECRSFTQLDEGEYDDLFITSDAIIHDCSSFIVEYAFTDKPCLYLVNANNLNGLLNDFGKGVMQVYEKAKSIEEVEEFVSCVMNQTVKRDKNKWLHFDNYVETYYEDKLPSVRIIDDIKQSLGVING
jgi:hypothetical protein